MAFIIGIITAGLAIFIQVAIKYGTSYKYYIISKWIQKTYERKDPVIAFCISAAINVTVCFLATMLCAFAPDAVGSGIPQVIKNFKELSDNNRIGFFIL